MGHANVKGFYARKLERQVIQFKSRKSGSMCYNVCGIDCEQNISRKPGKTIYTMCMKQCKKQ